ncbi:13928_t:CDS:2, partial [Gigaspora rosea]
VLGGLQVKMILRRAPNPSQDVDALLEESEVRLNKGLIDALQ